MKLYYLIYISSTIEPMELEALVEILDQSRENNEQNKITGLLLYAEGVFMQALEGTEENVLKLYDKIKVDTRHTNVITLAEGPLEKRGFSGWAMAFATVDAAKLSELRGYLNPVLKNTFKGDKNHPTMAMLREFAEKNHLTRIFPN